MIDTLNSNINRIICVNKIIKLKINKDNSKLCLKRVNSKCPAIILAVNRIERVLGRIKFLIVSINTIKGINIKGVPWGIKWANIELELFNQPNNINLNHIGNEILNEKIICLDLVKMYGYNPKILFNKIIKKIEVIIILFIWLNLLFKIILNSLSIKYNILLIKIVNFEGNNQ